MHEDFSLVAMQHRSFLLNPTYSQDLLAWLYVGFGLHPGENLTVCDTLSAHVGDQFDRRHHNQLFDGRFQGREIL